MRIGPIVIAVVALLAGYLLLWPVPIEPQAWDPPEAPATEEGRFAYNERLKNIERFGEGIGNGPEAVVVDAGGFIYTGFDDGRVVRLRNDGSLDRELHHTGGRPLGVSLGPGGQLLVADAVRGVIMMTPRKMTYVVSEAGGVPFGFTDDVASALPDSTVYFTDASSRYGIHEVMSDVFEHAPNGRLLSHDFSSGETRVLADGLYFPNGVAVGPGREYLLFNETTKYRVMRYWLQGEKAGQVEPFIENLPGFPDNITFNGRDKFWLALYSPRVADLDAMLPMPLLRKVVFRLPQFMHPKPAKHAFILSLGLDGQVTGNYQYAAADAFAPITSVREHRGTLYLGSLTEPSLGRIGAPRKLPAPKVVQPGARPGFKSPPPPASEAGSPKSPAEAGLGPIRERKPKARHEAGEEHETGSEPESIESD